ncbi:MAG TPA: hypothetical protein VIF62_20860 [Labilithrix sp.]
MERAQREREANEQREADRRRATLEANLQKWVGRPSSELVAKWTPTQSVSLPDRSMVIEYDFVAAELLGPTEESKVRLQRSEEASGDWCKERFVVAPDGRVKSYTWQGNGNGCPIE